jgi:hypothetical protein
MKKICAVSGEIFEVTEDDLKFYEKMGVPEPTLCPEERQRRRLAWRHGGKLFRIKCHGTGKETLSMYSEKETFPIYEQTYWWSDAWDAKDYARDFNFSRPFFEQFQELSERVPHISLVNTNSINSYYTSHGLNLKNCFVIVGGTDSEDCLYGYFIQDCRDTVDADSLVNCELCFSGNASLGCYNCSYFTHCRNCSDSFLLHDCYSCKDCIACVGLSHKQYYIYNKPYTKEEYMKRKKQYLSGKLSDYKALLSDFNTLKAQTVFPTSHQYNCEECTGDMLFHCHACTNSFDCKNSERCSFLAFSPNGLESYDCEFNAPKGVQFSYENVSTLGNNMLGNMLVWHGSDTSYSTECHNSNNLFGCIGLKHAEYCILNKQYSKDEYFALRDKIIEHMKKTDEWGEFFPIELSPFSYNETVAQEYFPMTKEAVLERGWKWRDDSAQTRLIASQTKIPDDIADVPDSICNEILSCETCGKNYKIQKAELKFYRKMNLPIPHKCSDCRHRDRMNLRNPRKLFTRTCDNCGIDIQTTFAPERPEKVYCEKCYLECVE